MKLHIEFKHSISVKLLNYALSQGLNLDVFVEHVLTSIALEINALVPNTLPPFTTMHDLSLVMYDHFCAIYKLSDGFNSADYRLVKSESQKDGFIIYDDCYDMSFLRDVITYCDVHHLHCIVVSCCVDGDVFTGLHIYS